MDAIAISAEGVIPAYSCRRNLDCWSETGQKLSSGSVQFPGVGYYVRTIAIFPDRRLVATSTVLGPVIIWNYETGIAERTIYVAISSPPCSILHVGHASPRTGELYTCHRTPRRPRLSCSLRPNGYSYGQMDTKRREEPRKNSPRVLKGLDHVSRRQALLCRIGAIHLGA